jgi:hypothetical protein
MKILSETENYDGSATFECDFSQEEQHALINVGFETLIREGMYKDLSYTNIDYDTEIETITIEFSSDEGWPGAVKALLTKLSAETRGDSRYSVNPELVEALLREKWNELL